MINIGIGMGWAKAIYSVANNVIANFKARVLSYPTSIFEAGPCLDATLEELNAIGLLDNASLVITPNAYNEGILYDVVPNTTLGDMTVVRATTATRVNSAGLIEVVPRNLLTYSLNFSSGYSQNQCTIGASQTDPFGTSNAKRITNAAVVTDSYFEQSISFSPNTYTWSIYVKQGTALTATIKPVHVGIGGDVSVMTFTFATETTTSSGAITTRGFTKLTNGWYRIYCSVNVTSAVSSLRGRFGNPSVANVYNDWFGAQLEVSSTATEYFPTTTRLNIPRIDYTNGSCPSLLVEPQRTNALTYSNDYSNVSWGKVGVTAVLGTQVNPEGIASTYSISNTTLGDSYLQKQGLSTTAGNYTMSVFVKNVDNVVSSQLMAVHLTQGSVTSQFTYTWATNTFALTGTNAISGSSVLLSNGWVRLSFTYSIGAGVVNHWARLYANNNLTITKSVLVYGFQNEAGTYPTSYIPTIASTVTRNADYAVNNLQTTNANWTVFIDCYFKPYEQIYNLYIGTTTSRFISFYQSFEYFRLVGNSGSGVFAGRVMSTTEGRKKIVLQNDGTDCIVFVNGVKLGAVNTSAATPLTGTSNIEFKLYTGGNAVGNIGKLNSLFRFDTKLTDAECIALTIL